MRPALERRRTSRPAEGAWAECPWWSRRRAERLEAGGPRGQAESPEEREPSAHRGAARRAQSLGMPEAVAVERAAVSLVPAPGSSAVMVECRAAEASAGRRQESSAAQGGG